MRSISSLKRAFPFGKPDGASPYVLSHRHGVWTELGGKADPAELARQALGPRLRAQSLQMIQRAETRTEALALLLMCPEFMRR